MIYDFPSTDEPIRQGDIFIGVPKVDIDFASGLPTLSPLEGEVEKIPWEDIVRSGESTPAVLPVAPALAIVASQDCDARWAADITLCEIKEFSQIEKNYGEISKLKKRVNFVTRQSCINLKWFYLPSDERIPFKKNMCVDFLSTINLPHEELESLIGLRKARLKLVAYDHFKERIAHFFRRYAYNEWYPLNKEEMQSYAKEHALEPSDWYPWQK